MFACTGLQALLTQHLATRHSHSEQRQRPSTPTLQTNCELSCTQPSPGNKLAFPPYSIHNLHNRLPLGSKTLPMTAQHVDGQLQYNTHNLYGLSEAAATHWALEQVTRKRPFILSRFVAGSCCTCKGGQERGRQGKQKR